MHDKQIDIGAPSVQLDLVTDRAKELEARFSGKLAQVHLCLAISVATCPVVMGRVLGIVYRAIAKHQLS